jgi:hypothetical protein
VRVVDWEETTEKAANVAANNHLIAGDFTDDIQGIIDELQDEIPELVEELRFEELEVELFGPHETVDHDGSGGPEEPETPELVKKWDVRRGQLWRCGEHLVYCGDSLDDDLPFPSRCDVVITDPPYQMDPADVRRVILAVADRASVLCAQKQAYALCDGHAEPSSTKWTRERSGALEFKHSMMWVHGQPRAGRGVNRHAPIMYHNEIVVCARRGVATGWERPRSAFSSVIGDGGGGFTNFGFGQGKSEHPFAEMIICYPDAKIVGDPFLGTGSTLVAADKTGRVCYGVELDESHLAICLERCSRLGLDPQLDTPRD